MESNHDDYRRKTICNGEWDFKTMCEAYKELYLESEMDNL